MSHYSELRAYLKDLWHRTIWGKPPPRGPEAFISRIMTPIFYGVFVLLGVLGYFNGVPALHDTYGEAFSAAYAVWQAGMALMALVCYAIPNPKTTWTELVFAGLLLGQYIIYAFLLTAYAFIGDADRGYVAGITLFGILAIVVRLTFLITEIRDINHSVREVTIRVPR